MPVNNDINREGARGEINIGPPSPFYNEQAGSAQGWKGLATPGTPPSRRSIGRGRSLFTILSILLLVMLVFAATRVTSVISGNNDQLVLKIGDQQQALIDLRQSLPISPDLFGVNVFPKVGTSSVDSVKGNTTGFMYYVPQVVNGLQNAGIKLLRFPGGSWGENHILSCQQLSEFSQLLYEVGADGMIQARLSSPITRDGSAANLPERANQAGRWVDFMSNPNSDLCTDQFKGVRIHPIKFWSVGNEPDKLVDPDTEKPFTVAGYVNDFVQFSIMMHQNNPTIKVFGPEISQFSGVGEGPKDLSGELWMDGFLSGVAAYENAHPDIYQKYKFHLLDGVSFHSYQFPNSGTPPYLLMSGPNEWNYLLPPLRQLIRQDFGRDLPVAITEINTNPTGDEFTRGQASLWWADTLGTLMNQQVEYVSFFSAEGVDSPYPLFNSNNLKPTAMYRVMELFSHLQPDLIPLQIQRDPISVYATQDDAHQTVSLLFINKSAANQFAEVSAQNQIFGTSPWHTQDISIAAYSMVLVTLHRSGGAQAYSFLVPSIDDATVTPLKQYVCGNKTDPLRYDIPC